MGVTTFVVDMNLIRNDLSLIVPNAFAGIHYLSMFGDMSYASTLPETMQKLIARWLYLHGFPRSNDVVCTSIERKIIELAYSTAERTILFESVQGYCRVLEVLHLLHCESWSLYDALISHLHIVVYGIDSEDLPICAPVPVIALPCWKQVHDVVTAFDLAVNVSRLAHVGVPMIAEKAMAAHVETAREPTSYNLVGGQMVDRTANSLACTGCDVHMVHAAHPAWEAVTGQ